MENITNNASSSSQRPGFSDRSQLIIWFAFGCIMLASLIGNGSVIWIITAHAKMRSITNFFLLNLSVSDLLLTILQVVPNVSYALQQSWSFGLFYCRVSNFMTTFSISLSVFTFMAIAIERYIVIMHPLRPRPKRWSVIACIIFIWQFSIITAGPAAVFSITDSVAHGFTSCRLSSNIMHIYDYILLTLQCVIPLSVVSFAYVVIGFTLWRQRPIGEQLHAHGDCIRTKRKIVLMMIIVVVIFAMCWIPYQLGFLFSVNSAEMFIALYFIAVCSTVPNPLIYCKMNSNFRLGFRKAFSCLPCVNVDDEKYKLLKFGRKRQQQLTFGKSLHAAAATAGGSVANNEQKQQQQQQQQQQRQHEYEMLATSEITQSPLKENHRFD